MEPRHQALSDSLQTCQFNLEVFWVLCICQAIFQLDIMLWPIYVGHDSVPWSFICAKGFEFQGIALLTMLCTPNIGCILENVSHAAAIALSRSWPSSLILTILVWQWWVHQQTFYNSLDSSWNARNLGLRNSGCFLLSLINDSFVYVVSVSHRPSTNSKVVLILRILFPRMQNR